MQNKLYPLLTYFWDDIILYIGYENGRGHRKHINIPSCVLSLGLQGDFKVELHQPANVKPSIKGLFLDQNALFLPNTSWSDTYADDCVMTLIFGPTNPLKFAIQERMQTSKEGVLINIENQTNAIDLFQNILDECPPSDTAKKLIDNYFQVDPNYVEKNFDTRVTRVITLIDYNLSVRPNLDTLSQEIGLSPSHIMALFKKETGVTISRYLLWRRFISTLTATTKGKSATEAALDFGFADGAQFSRTFTTLIGTSLTNILKNKDIIKTQYS